MARSTDGSAADNGLHNASLAPLNGSNGPFTIVLWFKPANLTQSQKYILQEKDTAVADAQYAVIWEYVDNQIEFFSDGFTGTDPRTGSGITLADTNWHHLAYRKAASGASEWAYFLDGVKTVISASINFTLPGTLSQIVLFESFSGTTPTVGNQINAALADVAFFTVSLSDERIAALADAYAVRGLGIRPAAHWELIGRYSPELDVWGNGNLTVRGTVSVTDHPRIIYPVAQPMGRIKAAAAAGVPYQPWFLRAPVLAQ